MLTEFQSKAQEHKAQPALKAQPAMNDAYAEQGGEAFRLVRKEIHLGIAVDVAGAGSGDTRRWDWSMERAADEVQQHRRSMAALGLSLPLRE